MAKMKWARSLSFTVALSLEDAWKRSFDFWKYNKVRATILHAQDLPDGTGRFMTVSQTMTGLSWGQDYTIVFKPIEGGTLVQVEAVLAWGGGTQWTQPLVMAKDLSKALGGTTEKIKWGPKYKKA